MMRSMNKISGIAKVKTTSSFGERYLFFKKKSVIFSLLINPQNMIEHPSRPKLHPHCRGSE
jgi:hypothetical protein